MASWGGEGLDIQRRWSAQPEDGQDEHHHDDQPHEIDHVVHGSPPWKSVRDRSLRPDAARKTGHPIESSPHLGRRLAGIRIGRDAAGEKQSRAGAACQRSKR